MKPTVCNHSPFFFPQLIHSQKVVMFKFQFWDCGDHAHRKFDHLLPVSNNTELQGGYSVVKIMYSRKSQL